MVPTETFLLFLLSTYLLSGKGSQCWDKHVYIRRPLFQNPGHPVGQDGGRRRRLGGLAWAGTLRPPPAPAAQGRWSALGQTSTSLQAVAGGGWAADMLQLLFFDTFSHDVGVGAKSELNLDLVQFPSPVYVAEVRVIPLGSRVTANFPGGVRLGATNPSTFQLEFFVNNLKAPGASTFESLGTLAYNSSSCISLPISTGVATDGLVLRGHYSTITLAVYGTVSDATPDQLAKQGAEVKREVKEEVGEVELPSTPVGESYAAQWTEKHKQVRQINSLPKAFNF